MNSMRLLSLSAVNFRGFGATRVDITLGSDLLLFYGPNGHGKTSLAEAIEWLFYGTTKRRERGDEFSRIEYAGTYGNIHGGPPVEVSARVLVAGREHVVARRFISTSEQSATSIDGSPGDFASLGIVAADSVYPVIVQHSLQSFIHAKPKERRDAMSEALGLQELASLKTGLDGARRSFQQAPPIRVREARHEIASYATGLALKPELRELARRWQQQVPAMAIDRDLTLLVREAQELTDSVSENFAELLKLLRVRRIEASKAVFDSQRIAPRHEGGALKTTFDDLRQKEALAFRALDEKIRSLLTVTLTAVSREFIALWQAALNLRASGDQCPVCEEPTFTAGKRQSLEQRLQANSEYLKAHGEAAASLRLWTTAMDALARGLVSARISSLERPQREVLRVVMLGQEAELGVFLAQHDAVERLFEDLDAGRGRCNDSAAKLEGSWISPERLPSAIEELKNERLAVHQGLNACETALKSYFDCWPAFQKALEGRIASTGAVAFIDALGKTLKNRHFLHSLVRYEEILMTSKVLMQSVEETLQQKQDEILGVRGAEVVDIYAKLNPGADVRFESMEPGTDHLKLHALSFGRRMSAAANLSQCQLNCLGLAVSLMQATTRSSPFGFVVLDDAVQSMDDDHCEAFMASLVPFLLDHHGKQVIVLSHLQPIIDRLRNLNGDRDFRIYHFESYGIQGPTIVEQAEFAKRLAEIKGLAEGNQDNRILAVDRLRVLGEKFVRAVYVKNIGAPVPPEHDTAQASMLLKVFLTIPGTTQQEYSALRDTIQFADPAHHSDAGYLPPQKSNIQPHLDRMMNLIRKYGLS